MTCRFPRGSGLHVFIRLRGVVLVISAGFLAVHIRDGGEDRDVVRLEQIILVANRVVEQIEHDYRSGAEDESDQHADAGVLRVVRRGFGPRRYGVVDDSDRAAVDYLEDAVGQHLGYRVDDQLRLLGIGAGADDLEHLGVGHRIGRDHAAELIRRVMHSGFGDYPFERRARFQYDDVQAEQRACRGKLGRAYAERRRADGYRAVVDVHHRLRLVFRRDEESRVAEADGAGENNADDDDPGSFQEHRQKMQKIYLGLAGVDFFVHYIPPSAVIAESVSYSRRLRYLFDITLKEEDDASRQTGALPPWIFLVILYHIFLYLSIT